MWKMVAIFNLSCKSLYSNLYYLFFSVLNYVIVAAADSLTSQATHCGVRPSHFTETVHLVCEDNLRNKGDFTVNLHDLLGFMYSMHVCKYSLVSRSTGTKAVYLLSILQALLVWMAYSWYFLPEPVNYNKHKVM